MLVSQLLLAACWLTAAPLESITLTPDSIAQHHYHLRCEPVADKGAAPGSPLTLHLRFGRLPDEMGVVDLEATKNATLVLTDEAGEALRVPVQAMVDPGNLVHHYVKFTARKDQFAKLKLVFEEDRAGGPQTFVVHLSAFIQR
jgi:hypothetical protein